MRRQNQLQDDTSDTSTDLTQSIRHFDWNQ